MATDYLLRMIQQIQPPAIHHQIQRYQLDRLEKLLLAIRQLMTLDMAEKNERPESVHQRRLKRIGQLFSIYLVEAKKLGQLLEVVRPVDKEETAAVYLPL